VRDASALWNVCPNALRSVSGAPETPLLYVLRIELDVVSSKFGCGLAQCGACSVLLDSQEIPAYITPVAAAAGKEVTTVEGLPACWAQPTKSPAAVGNLHLVQEA
jgi:isoquinoline 1-oxidoreductase alpha subunit